MTTNANQKTLQSEPLSHFRSCIQLVASRVLLAAVAFVAYSCVVGLAVVLWLDSSDRASDSVELVTGMSCVAVATLVGWLQRSNWKTIVIMAMIGVCVGRVGAVATDSTRSNRVAAMLSGNLHGFIPYYMALWTWIAVIVGQNLAEMRQAIAWLNKSFDFTTKERS